MIGGKESTLSHGPAYFLPWNALPDNVPGHNDAEQNIQEKKPAYPAFPLNFALLVVEHDAEPQESASICEDEKEEWIISAMRRRTSKQAEGAGAENTQQGVGHCDGVLLAHRAAFFAAAFFRLAAGRLAAAFSGCAA